MKRNASRPAIAPSRNRISVGDQEAEPEAVAGAEELPDAPRERRAAGRSARTARRCPRSRRRRCRGSASDLLGHLGLARARSPRARAAATFSVTSWIASAELAEICGSVIAARELLEDRRANRNAPANAAPTSTSGRSAAACGGGRGGGGLGRGARRPRRAARGSRADAGRGHGGAGDRRRARSASRRVRAASACARRSASWACARASAPPRPAFSAFSRALRSLRDSFSTLLLGLPRAPPRRGARRSPRPRAGPPRRAPRPRSRGLRDRLVAPRLRPAAGPRRACAARPCSLTRADLPRTRGPKSDARASWSRSRPASRARRAGRTTSGA